jgi:tetratricopeptide (TPR) repeat protein
MKRLFITFALGLFIGCSLLAQEDKVNELVAQGTKLHDEGKYDEAIAKYKAALDIDKNSTAANYELSYTCLASKRYEDGVKYSAKVIEQNTNNQHEAYIVLGSCLDMLGKPGKAIKTYEDGLKRYPNSNLLNYNLALTAYNQKEYDIAEKAAINAIIAKPTHGSSHIILATIMKAQKQRVKTLLPIFYSLMLEPNSQRSKINYNSLRNQLNQGVEKKDEKNININVPLSSSKDKEFDAAEMMISLLAASKYSEEDKNKNDLDLFAETTNKLFSMLGELKKDNKGFWWEVYVSKFYDLVQTKNDEAFSYYISQSRDPEAVNKWMANNSSKMQAFKDWMTKK